MATRIGVLVPSGNPTVEPELYRMAPPGVTLHFARLASVGDGSPGAAPGMVERTLGYADALPAAVLPLADVQPAAVVLAHTGLSYLTGFDQEPTLLSRLAALAGVPATTAARAILDAMAHLGARRIALGTPYPEVIAAAGRRYWTAAGLEVVAHRGLEGVTSIYDETEARARELGRAVDVAAADAVLLSGTGLPTAGIVEALERELGKPVVTSQTAGLWWALRAAGVAEGPRGFGRLLAGEGAR